MSTPSKQRRLPLDLTALQIFGLVGIFGSLVIWLISDRSVPTDFMTAFGGMLVIEEGRKAAKEFRK